MDDNPIGADDDRILVYARLIDPQVWPEGGDPEINPLTVLRLRHSLEGACRIAAHLGDLTDRSDIVARISIRIGLEAPTPNLALPEDADPAEVAALVAILLGNGPAEADGPTKDIEETAPASNADAPQMVAGAPEMETDDDEVSLRSDPSTSDPEDIDPDHDPEAGISHVGDADEGQFHEEERA